MLPEEFINRIKKSLGEEAVEFLRSFEEEPRRSLRINSLKKRDPSFPPPKLKESFALSPVEWCDNGYYYDNDTLPGKHPFHEAGLYYIQEASAMAPVQWLDIKRNMRVLDLCAAPGGKSTEIADLMENTGLLVANEPVQSRARILSLNVERMGIINTLVTNEEPEKLSALFEGYFDRILVDAPCSGEGMFRKNEDASGEWSPENVKYCAARQGRILKEAAKMLCPGGLMVYSTCTFSEEENEGTIGAFLSGETGFSLVLPEEIKALPDCFSKTPIRADGELKGFGVRIWPHRAKGEGHFFAVLKRNGRSPEKRSPHSLTGSLKKAKDEYIRLFYDFSREALPGFALPEGIIHSFGEQLYFSDNFMPGTERLKLLRPGLQLGTIKRGRFEPGHALALSVSPDMAARNAVLTDSDSALSYLRGESLPLSVTNCKTGPGSKDNGWCLMSFEGFSLGFGKSDGRIIKNHYPKGLRIN